MVARARLLLQGHAKDLLSRKWTIHIVRAISSSVKRHSELSRLLPDISQKVLTATLREMERNGIITRTVYPTIPPRVEYRLTPSGLGLYGVSEELLSWLEAHHEQMYRSQKLYERHKKEHKLSLS